METTATMETRTSNKDAISKSEIASNSILITSKDVIKNNDKISAFKHQFLKYTDFTGKADSLDELIQKREDYKTICNLFQNFNKSELFVKENPELKTISESISKSHKFFEEDFIISVSKIASNLLFKIEKCYEQIKDGSSLNGIDAVKNLLDNYKHQASHLDNATVFKSNTLHKVFELISKIECEIQGLK